MQEEEEGEDQLLMAAQAVVAQAQHLAQERLEQQILVVEEVDQEQMQ
jgi:hypothetical protein